MRLALLGVRGSTPAPGSAFVRYGGHTSCVAVLPDGPGDPQLILDAGTGLRDLPPLLSERPFTGAIVLTHLHWDHVQGLPFCPPVDRADARVAVPPGADPRDLLARGLSPPHFPIGPEGLLGDWTFHGTPDGLSVEGLTVTLARIAHRGAMHGVRIESENGVVAYLPDHSPGTASPELLANARRLASDVDVLLHDAQFTAGERGVADAYGHATTEDAVAFARACGARALVLTHHAPARSDVELDLLAAAVGPVTGADLPVTVAVQGSLVPVGGALRPVGDRPATGLRTPSDHPIARSGRSGVPKVEGRPRPM